MIEKEVISSAIKKIRYNEDNELLTITFSSGGSYDYPNVPKKKVEDMLVAPSIGKYFNSVIKPYSIKR